MGVETLVEGRDLLVQNDNVVYTRAPPPRPEAHRRHAYRRIDDDLRRSSDDFHREDSSLGVQGLFNAYRAGNVMIANALGHRRRHRQGGLCLYVAAVDPLVTCREEPILDNVETYLCREEKAA